MRDSCTYRTIGSVFITSTHEWIGPGSIVDLSDSTDDKIRELLVKGWIETADGEPVNTPVTARANCPCKDKEQ